MRDLKKEKKIPHSVTTDPRYNSIVNLQSKLTHGTKGVSQLREVTIMIKSSQLLHCEHR